jgi:hypothetical protein
MAPELVALGLPAQVKLEVDGYKCDIYSMGIMFANIANPKVELYEGVGVGDVLEAVADGKLRPSLPGGKLPPTITKLLVEMWSQDATQRPCASEIVSQISILFAAQDATQITIRR